MLYKTTRSYLMDFIKTMYNVATVTTIHQLSLQQAFLWELVLSDIFLFHFLFYLMDSECLYCCPKFLLYICFKTIQFCLVCYKLSLGRYHRWYHPPSSQRLGIDMVY